MSPRATARHRHRVPKQERVHRELRERILDGAYLPGERIVMDTIASEFGISALPVREAIRRLEAEGLVVFRPNTGARVAPADPTAFDQEMALLAVFEGYATALAAPNLDGRALTRLRGLNAQMEQAIVDMDSLALARLNREFHACIHERCGNGTLLGLLSEVARRLDAIRRTVFVQIPTRGPASIREHAAMLDLIAAGAGAAEIERAAREHKLRTIETFRAWRSAHCAA